MELTSPSLLTQVLYHRRVLAVNHVFSVLLHVLNGDSWSDALMAAMPQRRGAVPQAMEEGDGDEQLELEVGVHDAANKSWADGHELRAAGQSTHGNSHTKHRDRGDEARNDEGQPPLTSDSSDA